jgi:RND family efflux transporter MFP subunit
MKKNWKRILGIIVLVALVILVAVKLKSNKNTTEEKVYTYDKTEAIAVETLNIKSGDLADNQSFSGSFEPNMETKLSAETQGKINTILVDVGSNVSKGQALIRLDNSLLQLQAQSIDVQIEGFQADVNRYTILAQVDAIQGIQLEKAQLGLKSAKMQKATVLEQIKKTTIYAPFSGVVTAKMTEIGAFATPGMPLLQITDIHQLKFTIQVSENDLPNFSTGESYQITPDAYSEMSRHGKVILKGSKSNMGSSFPVQFLVSNTKNYDIKSGMFGKVKLLNSNKKREKGIAIPTSAIIGSADKPQVYIVKNGKAKLHTISISKREGSKAIVAYGLQENDQIVVRGIINLFDGANVTTQK